MGYSKEHVEKVRARILVCAGRAFRKHGYDGVGIDQIMADAKLTRGGFYAHFKSKSDLFHAVISESFDFTNQVKKLSDLPKGQIGDRVMFAVSHYLDPKKSGKIAIACTMASLNAEVARFGGPLKPAFGAKLEELEQAIHDLLERDKMARDMSKVRAAIAVCVGALTLARAMPKQAGSDMLVAARDAAGDILR